MKYIIDENGFLFGVGGSKTQVPNEMTFTEIEPLNSLIKPKFINNNWVEGANQNEIDFHFRQLIPETPLWRIRTILKVMGLESTIESAIETLSEPTRTASKYVWNYGTVIDRNSQTVQFIQSILNMNDNQVDEIFNQANSISI